MSVLMPVLDLGAPDAAGVVYTVEQILPLVTWLHDQMDAPLYGGPAGSWVDPTGVPEASRAFELLGAYFSDGPTGTQLWLEFRVLATAQGDALQALLDAEAATFTVEGTGLVEDGAAYESFQGRSVGFA